MPPRMQRHDNGGEIAYEALKKKTYRTLRSLAWEITENYKRVGRFFASAWVLCSCYVCTVQCAIQGYLHVVEEHAKLCEKDVYYRPSVISKLLCQIATVSPPKSVFSMNCLCGKGSMAVDGSLRSEQCVALVKSWLRERGINASLDDVIPWNDGTLMWDILRLESDRTQQFQKLDSSRKVENWSLIRSIIKRQYPGLIESDLLLHCLAASEKVCLHHIIHILIRIIHSHRRAWRAAFLKRILEVADALKSVHRPRFAIDGPGITTAKLNIRNEFTVRTTFPCPPFTVEVQDGSGEIWRETTNCARLANSNEECLSSRFSDFTETERPIEIVKVSRFLYRVFYVVRDKGRCKISIKPGKGGQVYGSPFSVNVNPSARRSLNFKEKIQRQRRSSIQPMSERKKPVTFEEPPGATAEQIQMSGKTSANGDAGQQNSGAADGTAHISEESVYEDKDTFLETGVKDTPGFRNMTSLLFRQISTGITTVSHRVISSVRKRGNAPSASRVASNRRTLGNLFDSSGLTGKSITGLNVPSSRNLKIRKVTVHTYLNKAMPSLEEYFFQKDFSVDDDNCQSTTEAGRRWSSISRLLRAKIQLMKKNDSEKNTPKWLHKERDAEKSISRKRRQRLRRTGKILNGPSRITRHSSDSLFKTRSRFEEISSSSSESGYDVFDEITRGENLKQITFQGTDENSQQRHLPTRPRSSAISDDPRFNHIFQNESGAADLILGIDKPANDLGRGLTAGREDRRISAKTSGKTNRHKSDSNISYNPDRKRRSGCAMCNRISRQEVNETRSPDPVETTKASYLHYADKVASKLIQIGAEEYAKITARDVAKSQQ